MVYSASSIVSLYKFNHSMYYSIRQIIYGVIGIIVMIVMSCINLTKLRRITIYLFIGCFVLLLLVLIPSLGVKRGGARSWIEIGSISIQPSEVMKLCMILLLAKMLTLDNIISEFKLFSMLFIIILFTFGIIMLQPDFGTGIVIVLSSFILLFLCGFKMRYFVILLIIGVLGILLLIISAPYRLERIFAFLDPFQDPLGSGFQAIQSIYAIAPSGMFGLGFGKSIQKHFFLPEPQNDFIFAIISEELGLFGGVIIVTLFMLLILRIIHISRIVEESYYKYLALGFASVIFVQVFINIGVVIGLLPITGITLPLISYGGTSLVITLSMIGITLNVSRYGD